MSPSAANTSFQVLPPSLEISICLVISMGLPFLPLGLTSWRVVFVDKIPSLSPHPFSQQKHVRSSQRLEACLR